MKTNKQSMFVTADGKNVLFTFTIVSSLFLLWGFCNGMIDVMDKHFQEELHLSLSQSAWVQFAHWMGYFLMSLPAGWLATRLGLPLYRVDLASVTSKYIGETEKNLARLLARAERTEALLLFDEADSLFGKRTDVRESNDRFANAQTNYLLQRMETFDGIAVLTSNSRARFDAAFSRRLDVVIEFPPPGPMDRRALWEAHLGPGHLLSVQELNLLAGQCDFAGGQIRNVVLAAAVAAREDSGRLDFPKILRALAAECRKAGRTPPPGLAVPKPVPQS